MEMTKRFGSAQCAPFLAIAVLSFWSVSSPAQARTFSVRDAIEMQEFTDPDSSYQQEDVKFSPDGRLFAVVTQRGILKTNQLESTVWVFDVTAVKRFLSSSSAAEPPKPKVVARMGAVANDSAITGLRWLSGTRLAFLGRNKSAERSVYTVNTATKGLQKLTPSGQDVTAFDIVNGIAVYAIAQRPVQEPAPIERVLTGQSIAAVLESKDSNDVTDFNDEGKPAELWVIRSGRASPVLNRKTGKPLQLMTSLLSLSPSGHSVIVLQKTRQIPKTWEEYDPAPCPACEAERLKEQTRPVVQDLLPFNPEQYAIIHLSTGDIDPIDAPFGLDLLYSGPQKAIWLNHQSVILSDTYLPLGTTVGAERQNRQQRPCVAIFNTASREVKCIATFEQNSRADLAKNGYGSYLRDVQWNDAAQEVTLLYETVTNGTNPAQHQHPPEAYHREKDNWAPEKGPNSTRDRLPQVEVHQDLNHAPALFVNSAYETTPRKLWDPNVQFNTINLGEVSLYHWKIKSGYEFTGGLVKPPDYVPGRRYPLVIQTHGFNPKEFMTVGEFTTGFAARPLAAKGMIVLQIDERFDLMGTPEELSLNVETYVSAVDSLVKDGLVDSKRVGIIGFSRTGYYALAALTAAPERFAAATVADGSMGYMGYLLSVGGWTRDSSSEENGTSIYGAEPVGEGLKAWLDKDPSFNLDKVRAPLRIETHGLYSLIGHWEVYASLRLQNKPVDLIQLPHAIHEVAKPLERFASEQGDVDWFDFWLNGHVDPDPAKAEQYSRWQSFRKEDNQILRSSE